MTFFLRVRGGGFGVIRGLFTENYLKIAMYRKKNRANNDSPYF